MKKYTVFSGMILLLITLGANATNVAFTVNRSCFGEQTILTSTSFSKDSILFYNWDLDGDGAFNDAVGKSITYVFPKTQVYSIGLQIITDVGDTSSYHKNVEIFPNPATGFTWDIPCSKDSTAFTSTSTISKGSIANYIWDFGDGNGLLLNPKPKHKYKNDATYSVNLVTVSDHGCFDSLRQTVEIFPTPIVKLTADPDSTFYSGESAVVGITNSYPTTNWSTGDATSIITVTTGGIYSVDVVDANGCTNSGEILITVVPKKDLEPIDILTPNNDGKNDNWVLLNTGGWKQITVNVFNRYGDEVYANDSYANDWDGTFNGKELPEGTYYYIVKIIDNGKVYTGSISILR